MVAQFAARQQAAEVILDDTDRSYMPSFPWAEWCHALEHKLDEAAIRLRRVVAGERLGGAVGAVLAEYLLVRALQDLELLQELRLLGRRTVHLFAHAGQLLLQVRCSAGVRHLLCRGTLLHARAL